MKRWHLQYPQSNLIANSLDRHWGVLYASYDNVAKLTYI